MRIIWWTLALFLVFVGTCLGGQYFIGEGPIAPYYMGPFSVRIYKLDTVSNSLEEVWSPSESDYFSGVKVYPEARTAVILVEPHGYQPTDRLCIVPFDSVLMAIRLAIDLRGTGTSIKDYDYIDNGDGHYFLRVHTNQTVGSTAAIPSSGGIVIDLTTGRSAQSSSLSADAITRLAGSGTAQNHWLGNVRRADLALQGDQWLPRNAELQSDFTPIPDSIVQMKNSFGWIQVFNDPEYDILQSVPERGGLASRELLIHDRSNATWSSIMIPGAYTKLSLLGDWVGGVVVDPDPDTDWEQRIGNAPIPRQEVVLVNPLERRFFTAHLGEDCGLLSIEGDVVLYRVGIELYRARIGNDDLIDREMLVKDIQVAGIGWAFNGGE